jgi:hypothetical protein
MVDNPKLPCLSWTELQQMVEKADIDRLLLFDCCYAAAAVKKSSTESTMELVAACGREVECTGPKWDGLQRSLYTFTLTKILEEWASNHKGLLVTELQTFLSTDDILNNQSPNHCVIEGHRKPILLKPLVAAKDQNKDDQTVSPAQKPATQIRVLIAISFRGDTLVAAQGMADWLGGYQLSDEVDDIEVRSVVESIYESCSTLVEVVIPLWLWASLPDLPGYSFVGFVKSNNLIDQFPSLQQGPSKPWEAKTPGVAVGAADQPSSSQAERDSPSLKAPQGVDDEAEPSLSECLRSFPIEISLRTSKGANTMQPVKE